MLGPKSTANFGEANPTNSEKCLFLTHSKMGSSFGCLIVEPSVLDEKTGRRTGYVVLFVALGAAVGTEQLSASASAVAEEVGSDTRAQGAWAEPAIKIERWNKPEKQF